MLLKLSAHIAACVERAVEAEQRAKDSTNPALRADNERMAQSWRQLARSYQFVESLESFLADGQRREADALRLETPIVAEQLPAASDSRPIIRRPRIKHIMSFRDRLSNMEREAREQLVGMAPGAERDRLLAKIRQCETAAQIDKWASSPGLELPDSLITRKKP